MPYRKQLTSFEEKLTKMLRLAPTLVLRPMKVLKVFNSFVTALMTLTRPKKMQKWN